MSAILGRIALDGRPVAAEAFHTALAALAPHGADGSGARVCGDAAMGQHFRHVGRGRADEGQPLQDGALTIVADAILDNRAELLDRFDIPPAAGRALTDSALILRAFRKWGADAPRHLLGDFAFAIWDAETRRLLLARDHIGARPLYWTRQGGTLAFCTDVTGLLALTDLDWQIDEAAVARYMMQPDIPPPKGFLRELFILPPGHVAEIDAGGIRETRWWRPEELPAPPPAGDDAAQIRALLDQAVACRIDTDLPVGSHFSGGIDSTAVAVLAARQLRGAGRALVAGYSWSPPVSTAYPDIGPGDERRRIETLAAAEGIACRFLDADLGAVKLAALTRPLEVEGIADLSEELAVIARAQADGVGVMLSGWGGDECVSAHGLGYPAWLLQHLRPGAAIGVARRSAGGFRRAGAMLAVLWRHGVVPMLPDALHAPLSGHVEIYPDHCFISPALRIRAGLAARAPGPLLRETADPRGYLLRLVGFGHLAARMETWAAWAAPAALTYRYPLTDRRLMEYLLSLPFDRLFARDSPRALMRAALVDVLPRLPKADPVQQEMRDRMRQSCWRALQADPGRITPADCPWIDMPRLRAAIANMPASDHARAIAFAELSGAMRVFSLHERWYGHRD